MDNAMKIDTTDMLQTIEAKMAGVNEVKTPYFTAQVSIKNEPYYVTGLQINTGSEAKRSLYECLIAMTIDKVMDLRNCQVQRAMNHIPESARRDEKILMQKLPLILRQVYQKDSKFHKTEMGNIDGQCVAYFYDRQVLGNNQKKYERKLDHTAGVAAVEIKWDVVLKKFPYFKPLLDRDFDGVELEAIKVVHAAHTAAIAYINALNEVAKKEINAKQNKINKKRVKIVR